MANPAEHIEQWRHNRCFLSAIPKEYPDWMVTVVFYTALHAVDVLLAKDGQTVTTHAERNAILIRTHRYAQIRKHYLPLYDLSRTIRYLAKPAAWTPANIMMDKVIRGLLYPIEKSVQKLIDQSLGLPEIVLQDGMASASAARPGHS